MIKKLFALCLFIFLFAASQAAEYKQLSLDTYLGRVEMKVFEQKKAFKGSLTVLTPKDATTTASYLRDAEKIDAIGELFATRVNKKVVVVVRPIWLDNADLVKVGKNAKFFTFLPAAEFLKVDLDTAQKYMSNIQGE
jgi:hypothetical protein